MRTFGEHLLNPWTDVSRLDQSIEQCPGEHEAHEAAKGVADPEVGEGVLEEGFLLAAGTEKEDEELDDDGAGEEEGETGIGLEAKCACSDAEQGCGQGAYVRGDLFAVRPSRGRL